MITMKTDRVCDVIIFSRTKGTRHRPSECTEYHQRVFDNADVE